METMDTLDAIFLILNTLGNLPSLRNVPYQIAPLTLDIETSRWYLALKILDTEGLIAGLETVPANTCSDNSYDVSDVCITLKGLEYLVTNPVMKRIAEARGLIIVPNYP